MISFRRLAKITVTGTILLLSVISTNAQDGKTLFQTNCASCHAVHKKLTGPALAGVEDRWPDRAKLHAWVHNPAGYAKGDAYATNLIKEYAPTLMTSFPALSEKEIDAILDYIKTVPDPSKAGPAAGPATEKGQESDNTLLFGVLTLILAVVALTLLQVNANLKKLADEKEGHGGI
ncbi:MAG TPA: cytochrome c, partial [Sediminibacterium sp.]